MFYFLLNSVCLSLLVWANEVPKSSVNSSGLIFEHDWDFQHSSLTIFFEITNSTFDRYRFYYFEFHLFSEPNHIQYFPREALIDRRNSLKIIGLHENDYVFCISFIDELENVFKPRSACYEFTIGEKSIGSHHAPSSGLLSPLLVAVVFVIHVFIAVVHYIKAKDYAHKLLERFINVNRSDKRHLSVLPEHFDLFHRIRPSASIQRRLSRVSIDAERNENSQNSVTKSDELPMFIISNPVNPRPSISIMQTIAESNH